MSYNHIADAAQDSDLRRRVAACFAQQTTGTEQPEALASVHKKQRSQIPNRTHSHNQSIKRNYTR